LPSRARKLGLRKGTRLNIVIGKSGKGPFFCNHCHISHPKIRARCPSGRGAVLFGGRKAPRTGSADGRRYCFRAQRAIALSGGRPGAASGSHGAEAAALGCPLQMSSGVTGRSGLTRCKIARVMPEAKELDRSVGKPASEHCGCGSFERDKSWRAQSRLHDLFMRLLFAIFADSEPL